MTHFKLIKNEKEKPKNHPRMLELVRWFSCGKSQAEELAERLSNNNKFDPINSDAMSYLLVQKGYPLQGIKNVEYYVYYNYHPSSGYETVLYINDSGGIEYEVKKPEGVALSAFFSEVVIFTIVD